MNEDDWLERAERQARWYLIAAVSILAGFLVAIVAVLLFR